MHSQFLADHRLSRVLKNRAENGLLRKLSHASNLIDFCSNDYLGLARLSDKSISDFIPSSEDNFRLNGSTGSRLLSGNSILAEDIEKYLATFFGTESTLLYNSGYDANMGLFSCISDKGDTILFDELVHASIYDGIRLGLGDSFSFQHNNLYELEVLLTKVSGNIFIAVESVYSMDGDTPDFKKLVALAEKFHAHLIVDEAHATGVFGTNGKGISVENNIENKIFARIHTFGKAVGCHGAVVAGSSLLRNYLINYSRAFIYTTALPPRSLHEIYSAIKIIEKDKTKMEQLHQNINLFNSLIIKFNIKNHITSRSPIQCILQSGNNNAKNLAEKIRAQGFDVRAVLSPTVPITKERIRICLHSFNSTEEITRLVQTLASNII